MLPGSHPRRLEKQRIGLQVVAREPSGKPGVIQEIGTAVTLAANPKIEVNGVVASLCEGVFRREAIIADAEREKGLVPAYPPVEAGSRQQVIALEMIRGLPERPYARCIALLFRNKLMIIPDERAMRSIDAELEPSVQLRAVHKFEFGMQRIASPRFEIERFSPIRILFGTHVQHIGLETVGTAVRWVEHFIIEVQVEPHQGIRDVHPDPGLAYVGRLALIDIGHFHRGIEILSERERSRQQASQSAQK